jgi:CBS domain-containing protein
MLTRPVAVLIRNQVVLTSPPQETVRVACQRMRERYVGSVVVTDERNHLVGIFTERDAICRVLAEGRDAERTTLAKVMTTEVATVSPQATALEALRIMQDGGFRHVPVVASGRVVGIVSYTDFRGQEHARLEHETELFETIR